MRRCQSVRGSVWYIGGKRKCRQRGGMFPIWALAEPILGTLGGVVVKNYLEVEKDAGECNMYRYKVLLRRKVTPKRVTLPNGRSFIARYERVSRKNLPSNVTIRRNRTTGPR